ncbi:MAG TPA: hypothetical protein VJ997_03325, partial [Longimicrobiales bacterium]|nr:hypothetical protein [Longimicrobiales bacterium]
VLLYPNPESLGARAFGPHWFAWDAPRHLVLPPVRAAVELGRRVGLRCRSARTLPRWAADHAMQSRAYRRGEGLQAGPPGPLDGIFGALERALMILGADVGEEALLALEYRP